MFIPILILSIIIVFGGIFYVMTEKPEVPQVQKPEPLPPQEYDEEALKQSQLDALAKLTPPTHVEEIVPVVEETTAPVESKPKKKKRYYSKPKTVK